MASSAARVASIDIGTNSVRLLVAELGGPTSLKRLWGDRSIARLGEGVGASGRLGDQAIARALMVVKAFVDRARLLGAQRLLAAATSAVREASNGLVFLKRLEELTGVRARVLSGEEEALWMMEGIRWVWEEPPETWVAVDMGGGSTELILAQGSGVRSARSLPLGMVRLTEEFFHQDPPDEASLQMCRKRIREMLGEALRSLGLGTVRDPAIAGTAGTITTLAALDRAMSSYDGDALHGTNLSRLAVRKWRARLSGMDSRARRSIPGMEPGREDVIVAGALMVEELLDMLGAEAMVVSDHGLLEGMARMAPLFGQSLGPESGKAQGPRRSPPRQGERM